MYFIRAGDKGPIKIGSSNTPLNRLRELQTGHSEDLHLLGVILAGSSVEEKLLHKKFQYLRQRGEWFIPAEPLLEFIEMNAIDLPRPDITDVDLVKLVKREMARVGATGWELCDSEHRHMFMNTDFHVGEYEFFNDSYGSRLFKLEDLLSRLTALSDGAGSYKISEAVFDTPFAYETYGSASDSFEDLKAAAAKMLGMPLSDLGGEIEQDTVVTLDEDGNTVVEITN